MSPRAQLSDGVTSLNLSVISVDPDAKFVNNSIPYIFPHLTEVDLSPVAGGGQWLLTPHQICQSLSQSKEVNLEKL